MHRLHSFVRGFAGGRYDWCRWQGRGLVLGYAALAGLCVVGFTWLTERAFLAFEQARAWQPLLPLVWTPACTAGLVWLTRRLDPGAGGSGIPQVIAGLSLDDPKQRSRFVSLKLALQKSLLTAGGLLGGLTVGREGPSVQVAAGVVHSCIRWLPRGAGIDQRSLLIAGGAVGVAASFNAPLAGVMFAIETLARRVDRLHSGLVIAAIVLGGLVAVSIYGNAAYFGVIRPGALHVDCLVPGVLTAVACGVLGGVFSKLLLASLLGDRSRICGWRLRRPVLFAGCCGLLVAVIGVLSEGATFGSGSETTRGMVEGAAQTSALYVPLRFIATWLTAWSGVPGGLFVPSLSIGAGIGHDIAAVSGLGASSGVLVAIGMAAFLAAVTQAPMTAFIIVMEMVDGRGMVLSLMAAALTASAISRLLSRSLYSTLADALVLKATATTRASTDTEDVRVPR